ncbi:probable inactive receptor-like protein kinase At3g56050 [Neltuma alba]|uniref:probable inactive receptor-like protein kinase At3g56050 n=1 Tax=Neltuma alba TaxID=207710 RepID=UPI0010A4F19D|nr:probable inactive receptor-like protein kinase At3g56050 [Prosopis alba]
MKSNWNFSRYKDHRGLLRFLVVWLLFQSLLGLCSSLNDEGKALLKLRQRILSDPFGALSNWIDEEGEVDPCNWFRVQCVDGRVVVLNLKDLCLGGTLVPELAKLVHVKSIILRNNSFYGIIPEEIAELKELEVLDLGYNNFSGSLPADLGSNISLAMLLLDNNELLGGFSPEINELKMLSESQVDENQLTGAAKLPSCASRSISQYVISNPLKSALRRLLQKGSNRTAELPPAPSPAPAPAPAPAPVPSPSPSHPPSISPPPSAVAPVKPNKTSPGRNTSASPSPKIPEARSKTRSKSFSKNHVAILVGAIGGGVFLILIAGIYVCRTNKVTTVKPWATGLSGQLQKAFVTGVPKLKRSELVAACEDFSNVLGTSPIGTVYKGTLSSGVEIAVASVTVTSSNAWSKTLEVQFRKKIDSLSKVNHKNLVNLLGYCEEEEPFTRMMVFEYAPNGTLFEHLHIKEAEHLDWRTRLRIAMGMAYCLQYVHQLDPPVALSNMNSSSIFLTEDYAAKIADLSFSYEIASSEMKTKGRKQFDNPLAGPQSNVYDFGVVLFEMVTSRVPYSVDDSSLENWASDYLQVDHPLREMVDPTLASFDEEKLEQVAELIKSCVHPDPKQRPSMKDVSMRLREITNITPDAAVPRLSPLWWAELEICSADAS